MSMCRSHVYICVTLNISSSVTVLHCASILWGADWLVWVKKKCRVITLACIHIYIH